MPLVAADRAVAVGAQRDDAGGIRGATARLGAAVDDDVRPLAVEVDLVGGGVEVPRADARRAGSRSRRT